MIKPWNEIIVGSIWRPNDGGKWRVKIVSVTKDLVVYEEIKSELVTQPRVLDREPFYFQVRYREDNE